MFKLQPKLGFVLAGISTLAMILTVVAITIVNLINQQSILNQNFEAKSLKTNETISQQLGTAVKFKQAKAIEGFALVHFEDPISNILSMKVFDAESTNLVSVGEPDHADLISNQTITDATASNEMQFVHPNDHGIQVIHGINFKNSDSPIGYIVTQYSDAAVHAAITSLIIKNLVLGVSMIVILSILIIFAYSKIISRPLITIEENMRILASGDMETKKDIKSEIIEITNMAEAVDTFRKAAIEKKSLERQSEENRVLSEEERQRAEQLKAIEADNLAKAIQSLGDGLSLLSEGDLTVNIQAPFEGELDRLRLDFNTSIATLAKTMAEINGVSTTLKDNSFEISNATNELSQRTEKQAASLEETSAALDEITATVRETSERAKEAANSARDARNDTQKSSEVVSNAVSAMEGIERASSDITNIINVIDEIAFQTNLLALNAGVEAARAGEAGKGFAVVAQEVRELAQRSATAAKEIKELINKSGAEVNNGVQLVKETGAALSKISEHVSKIDSQITTISSGASEQLTGIQEVNAAVSSMDHSTQQNAAMVEENTAVTRMIAEEVKCLAGLIATFEVAKANKQHAVPNERMSEEARTISSSTKIHATRSLRSLSSAAIATEPTAGWDEF
ncbi:MAG: methyl-accepting chemotaxis protein [Rhizobiaceae bacterium]|nr:methyl-accepting chemotaxis protein [Rhizobiaceae bacterium]